MKLDFVNDRGEAQNTAFFKLFVVKKYENSKTI